MARKPAPPSYCLHKPTGQAYTRVLGRMLYLGEYDSKESRTKWAKVVSDWSEGNLDKYGESVSVARLAVAYILHAKTYYQKNGKATSEAHRVRYAMKHLVDEYGKLRADKFTPKHLERVRAKMIEKGFVRKTINDYTAIISRAFRFGVVEGSLPASVWQSLKALPGLRKGRSKAIESDLVQPVHPFEVIKTLRELGPVVARMVRLQYITGMRPGEVCSMRLCNIDRSEDVWKYAPEGHKTEHHGRSRVIMLGPKAQRILQPLLNRSEESYLFSPEELIQAEGVIGCMHYAQQYDRESYTRAIVRAAKRAGVKWSPNQLRHTYATIIRKHHGLEAAQILLGHSKADVTQIYAERDLQKAVDVVREVG